MLFAKHLMSIAKQPSSRWNRSSRALAAARTAAPARVDGAKSVGEVYRIELAPFAQGSFRRLRTEIVPAIKGVSSRQQGLEFLISAALAEYVPNFIEVVKACDAWTRVSSWTRTFAFTSGGGARQRFWRGFNDCDRARR
jgi:hypothetical protein